MKKPECESSRQGEQNGGNSPFTVRMPAGSYKLTDRDRESLRALAACSDAELDFSDIPAVTHEEFEAGMRSIEARRARHLEKAS